LIYGYAMSTGLFFKYAMDRFGLNDKTAGDFLLATTIATALMSPLLGIQGDRLGHKTKLALACAAHAIAALLAATAGEWRVLYGVFALTAVGLAAQLISARNYIYLFGVAGRRPTYLALASTLPAPFILAFSLTGGYLAQEYSFGYAAAFILSAAICVAALLVLVVKVRTPDERR
jgi:MFS family permease